VSRRNPTGLQLVTGAGESWEREHPHEQCVMLVDVSHRHAAPTSLRLLMWALRGASGTFLSMTGEQSQDRRCLAVAAKPYASLSPSFFDTASQQCAQVHPLAWKAPVHNGLPSPPSMPFSEV
jgi:hypothetical protein